MTVKELKEKIDKAKETDIVIFKSQYGGYGDVNKVIINNDEMLVVLYER